MRRHQGEGPEPYRQREPRGPPRGSQSPPERYARGGTRKQQPPEGGQHSPPPGRQPPQQWHEPPPSWNEPPRSVGGPSGPREQPAPAPVGGGSWAPEQQPPGAGYAQPPQAARSSAGLQQAGGPDQQWGQGGPAPGPAGGPRLAPSGVEGLVQTDVVTAEVDTPIATVVAQMAEQDVGSVVVVEDGAPVGILTDRQIALALETTPDVADRVAEDVMDRDLVTGTTDMDVFEVLRRLEEESVRRLPIVDENGDLEGIVTLDDVLVHLGTEFQSAASIIRSQSTRL